MGMLPYIVAFEAASSFSHLLYAARRLGPAYLKAHAGLDDKVGGSVGGGFERKYVWCACVAAACSSLFGDPAAGALRT